MWVNQSPAQRTCTWWMFSALLPKPLTRPNYYGVKLTVPAEAKTTWPTMLFMMSNAVPPAFSIGPANGTLWGAWWANATTTFCALATKDTMLTTPGKAITHYLPCREGADGSGANFTSALRYMVGFAIDPDGSVDVPRWGGLTWLLGPGPPQPPPAPPSPRPPPPSPRPPPKPPQPPRSPPPPPSPKPLPSPPFSPPPPPPPKPSPPPSPPPKPSPPPSPPPKPSPPPRPPPPRPRPSPPFRPPPPRPQPSPPFRPPPPAWPPPPVRPPPPSPPAPPRPPPLPPSPPAPSPPPSLPSPPSPPPNCPADRNWQEVRARFDTYAAGYAGATNSSQDPFNNTLVQPFLSFPLLFLPDAKLAYDPVEVMWGSGDPANRTCVWWLFSSTRLKPNVRPDYYGASLIVPSEAGTIWPSTLFMLSSKLPPAFTFGPVNESLWADWWGDNSTTFCALVTPGMVLPPGPSATMHWLPCRDGADGSGGTFHSSLKYMVGFAIDQDGTIDIPRWSALDFLPAAAAALAAPAPALAAAAAPAPALAAAAATAALSALAQAAAPAQTPAPVPSHTAVFKTAPTAATGSAAAQAASIASPCTSAAAAKPIPSLTTPSEPEASNPTAQAPAAEPTAQTPATAVPARAAPSPRQAPAPWQGAAARAAAAPEASRAPGAPAPAAASTQPPLSCPADPTWSQVRRTLDQYALYPTVTDTTQPFEPGVTDYLSFSPTVVANLVYDPADPMWYQNDRSKRACAWWFFSSGNKPSARPAFQGVQLEVPPSAVRWPSMLFMTSWDRPPEFQLGPANWASWWQNETTQSCALFTPEMALPPRSPDEPSVHNLTCRGGVDGTGAVYNTTAQYMVGFAIDGVNASADVPRWSALTGRHQS
ncbi:hypothetical protein ABPG75_004095 [Micractinium tetrahymenae]